MIDLNQYSNSSKQTVDPVYAFKNAMQNAGIDYHGHIVPDGKIQRFSLNGKKDKSGWYRLTIENDFAYGCFGDWSSTDGWHKWCSVDEHKLTPGMITRRKVLDEELKKQQEEDAAKAALECQTVWNSSLLAPNDFPYLVKKGVPAHDIRIHDGHLIIPMRDNMNEIHSLQRIYPDGQKYNWPGGDPKGHYFTIQGKANEVYLCEGYATGASIHAATGGTVIIAFTAGQLLSVAANIKKKYSMASITVCADNDQWNGNGGNAGMEYALKASKKYNLKVVWPEFPGIEPVIDPETGKRKGPTDFNDLATLEGIEAVRLRIQESDDTSLSYEGFTVKEWPELNPKALYGLAGIAVELATRNSEADPAAVLFQFLAFFGAKCGAGVKFFVGDTAHYPRLNVAVIGNSSKARKGTSAQPVKKFFKSDSDMVSISPGPLSSGEGIIDAVRDETREYQLDKKTSVSDWVVTDPGVEDKRFIILDEELASALASMKRDGNKLSTIIRCMWDSGTCAPLTKTAKTRCTDAHVIICTHSTFSELKAKLEDCEHLNGFANRFLWILARRKKIVSRPLPMPEDELEMVRAGIEKAFRYSKNTSRLYFNDEAWNLWDKVYPDLTKDHPGYSGAIVNRGEAQATRLSMIYALMDCSDKIKPVHLEAALAAWDYCRASALYIFGDREEDNLTQKIINALEEGPKTATDISNALQRNFKSTRIKSSLDDLIARNRIKAKSEKTQGRPKIIFYINEKNEVNEISHDADVLNSLNSFNSYSYKKNLNSVSSESGGDYVEI